MTTFDAPDERAGGPSRVIWIIVGSVVLFLVWAALAWVDEIVRAPGQVVSSSRPQIIQNLEGGILAELDVAEGQEVAAGQVLGRLHGTLYQSRVDELRDQIAALDIRRLRLEAEMAGADGFEVPVALSARLPGIVASEKALLAARAADLSARAEGARQVMAQAATEMDLMETMLARELVPLIEVTRVRKVFRDAENRHSDIVTQGALDQATEYSRTLAEIAALTQGLTAAEDQLRRTVLVAPMRGVVNRLSVTTIGGVVRPGEEILQIAPLDEAMVIEARVDPANIAAVRVGQKATVKLSAYDYTAWGTLEAEVVVVSADIFRDERSGRADGDPHYKVTLKVDPASRTGRAGGIEIRPGMQAEVELQTGGKTVLTYLLKPLWKSREALRER
ncbi:MAG: HlyD family efflux transporter periplasmic adaptor subunit [Gemmobacter sp.]